MTDRLIPPSSEELNHIDIIEGKTYPLENGINLHYIDAGTSDVLKFDLVFDAGVREQNQNGIAAATSSMLSEGTKNKTAQQIAEELDFYGAYLQARCSPDDSMVTLYCLKKHFNACIPYVMDVIQDSVFPEKELAIYKQNAIQRLMVNQQRNSFLVRRLFYSSVFGETHPYGIFSKSTDYENISRETIQYFYAKKYAGNIKYILFSGAAEHLLVESVAGLFTSFKPSPPSRHNLFSSGEKSARIFLEKQDAIQSAIRIGKKMFNRSHPDFQKMQLLNLILGGYFGSRLMKNIREEKGLTYGIYSVLESYRGDGCFYIETEINNELRETGITEIHKELHKLRTEPVSEDELKLAKNYLLGSFLRSIDGPFSLADRYKILIDYGLTYEYYRQFIDTINHITVEDLLDLANQHLAEADLSEVVVGKK